MSTLFRDFEKHDYPKNTVIVAHGMTNRVFLMRFLHLTVEQFEAIKNPKNCGFYVLDCCLDPFGGTEKSKYKLVAELDKYPHRRCKH